MSDPRGVVVVTGIGGMGQAVARRIGSGSTVIIADSDERLLETQAGLLSAAGHDVVSHVVDVSHQGSVEALAGEAAARGPVTAVVHTAGLSPVQAPVHAVLRVDLLGTALMLDAFGGVMSSGGAGVFISSMAGTMASLDAEFEHRLGSTPTGHLLELDELGSIADSATAYVVAKRANQIRVKAASHRWGRRGARVNSISPGVISTSMGLSELEGPNGVSMRAMISGSGTGRIGTAEDIAGVVDFLVSRHADFITGTDVLVDGGVVASLLFPDT
jgi:NAD(P)-dependent dehydrogenase (short-subunit alcohol dehydrogenase family)